MSFGSLMHLDQVSNMDNRLLCLLFFLLPLPSTFVDAKNIENTKEEHAAGTGLTLLLDNDMLAFINISAKLALTCDYSSQYLLLDGNSGSAIYTNSKTSKRVTIPKGVWKPGSDLGNVLRSFYGDLNSVTGKDGAVEGISNYDDAAKIIAALISEIGQNIMRDPKNAESFNFNIAKQAGEDLDVFEKAPYYLNLNLPYDLVATVNTLLIIHNMIIFVDEAFAYSDVGKILEAHNGMEALVYAFNATPNDREYLVYYFRKYVHYKFKDNWSSFIANLGGNIPVGVNGLIRILADIADIQKDPDVNLIVLINDLIRYVAQTPANVLDTLRDDFKTTSKQLLDTIKSLNHTKDFSEMVKLLNDIVDENVGEFDMDITKFLDILITDLQDTEPFIVIVKFLEFINSLFFKTYEIIPKLLLVLIAKLDSAHDVELQQQLFDIPLNISIDSINGSILKSVLSSAGDLKSLKSGNVYNGLTKLKVIKNIVEELDGTLEKARPSKATLKVMLGGNRKVKAEINALVQLLTNEDLGASDEDLNKAQKTLDYSAGLMALTHFSPDDSDEWLSRAAEERN